MVAQEFDCTLDELVKPARYAPNTTRIASGLAALLLRGLSGRSFADLGPALGCRAGVLHVRSATAATALHVDAVQRQRLARIMT